MYIDAHLRQIDTLNNKIKDLKTNNKSVVKNKPTTIEKIVEVEKIIKVKEDCKAQIKQKVGKLEQLVRLQQKAILSIRSGTSSIDKTKYKTYTCKDMLKGSFYIPKSCTKMLYKFLDKNKDAKMFEVIGVVDASEFKVLTKIKEPQNKSKVIKIANFAQLGLAYRRVKEGKWAIRYYLDKNVNIQVVNYIIKSKKKSKGFVVRAYKYIIWKELKKQTGIEFDLLYDPIGIDTFLEYLKDKEFTFLYIHQGGIKGNVTMIERYRYKWGF